MNTTLLQDMTWRREDRLNRAADAYATRVWQNGEDSDAVHAELTKSHRLDDADWKIIVQLARPAAQG